jgi:hypothetical protein
MQTYLPCPKYKHSPYTARRRNFSSYVTEEEAIIDLCNNHLGSQEAYSIIVSRLSNKLSYF